MTDQTPSAANPHGSCLACGHDLLWVAWHVDVTGEPTIGLCATCKAGADAAARLSTEQLREHLEAQDAVYGEKVERPYLDAANPREWRTPTEAQYADALERTDQALRAVLAGKPVRDADEILSANAWLLFAAPSEADRG